MTFLTPIELDKPVRTILLRALNLALSASLDQLNNRFTDIEDRSELRVEIAEYQQLIEIIEAST